MKLFLSDWLLNLYYEVSSIAAGVTKYSILLGNDKDTMFSYYEKGKRVPGQSSMIFIHGFGSNKESWLSLIQNIPDGYHCIIIDLPCHGETLLKEDDHSINAFVDNIKLFLDQMNLTKPMDIIGTSIGATIVAIFATKYPEYISMMCLLAPVPIKEYESDLLKQVRSGKESILLPETSEEFHMTADNLMVKVTHLPEIFMEKYFKSRLHRLDEQKEIMRTFIKYEYLNLEQYYKPLQDATYPVLIIWGRRDQLCVVESVEYFSKLISNSEVNIFDDCGHFISYDKPKETANSIVTFLDLHSFCVVDL